MVLNFHTDEPRSDSDLGVAYKVYVFTCLFLKYTVIYHIPGPEGMMMRKKK